MINERRPSATRIFSKIKNNQNPSPIKYFDNVNNQNFEINNDKKEKKDRGEFLKRLIQTEEDEENHKISQINYNVYSNPKMLYLDDNNDTYRNSIIQESEKKMNKSKNSNSKQITKKKNNYMENEEFQDKNNNNNSEGSKKHKNKKKYSFKSKKKITHTVLIRNKSAKMSLLKKMNNLDKLKNTVFTKFSIGNNITYDDKEDSKNINNLFNNLNKNNDLINDENTIKEDEDNYKLNNINLNNLKSRNTIKTIENKKNENIEQLKIGDIVIIISIIEYNLNESNKELENIIKLIEFNDFTKIT